MDLSLLENFQKLVATSLQSIIEDLKTQYENQKEELGDRIVDLTIKVKKIDHKWACLRSFFPDRTPVVGEDPDMTGFYWLAGQGGYGIQTSPGISKIIECLVTGKDWPYYLSNNSIMPETLSPKRKSIY